jgi:DNA-binding NarL/FixJ family response regulator
MKPPKKSRLDKPLTVKEILILQHMAEGLNSKEIAHQIGHTEQTLRSYRKIIYEKLGVSNSASAVLRAIQKGLIVDSYV